MKVLKSFIKTIGDYLLLLKTAFFSKPENFKLYLKEFFDQAAFMGINTIPIVLVVSIFLGAVTVVQIAYQLVSPLVPLTSISQVARDIILLELSPTILSIILAGVIGSKIASEIGNMRVSEQIDALEIMGVNSASYLITPKVLASLFAIPILVIFSIIVGIIGGRIAATMSGIVSGDIYDMGLQIGFKMFNVWYALTKAFTFAFIISTASAYYGYKIQGGSGSLEIGEATTRAVVTSAILILIADYVIATVLL
ncbi:MlaE family ABC transporter permease [Haoranjiania flava]|uniref:ABC transporter permease n=1 Tax=Haoranjiania flava TaxID=1856322 RepID=A0AAE3IK89_9BACT|nr:ABC transporter permease [Haoranjiania flava]MCU7693697.1 ABC transporter permease [Haoranjiania flava]